MANGGGSKKRTAAGYVPQNAAEIAVVVAGNIFVGHIALRKIEDLIQRDRFQQSVLYKHATAGTKSGILCLCLLFRSRCVGYTKGYRAMPARFYTVAEVSRIARARSTSLCDPASTAMIALVATSTATISLFISIRCHNAPNWIQQLLVQCPCGSHRRTGRPRTDRRSPLRPRRSLW